MLDGRSKVRCRKQARGDLRACRVVDSGNMRKCGLRVWVRSSASDGDSCLALPQRRNDENTHTPIPSMPKPELEFFKTVSVPEEVMDEKGLASEQCASFWL